MSHYVQGIATDETKRQRLEAMEEVLSDHVFARPVANTSPSLHRPTVFTWKAAAKMVRRFSWQA